MREIAGRNNAKKRWKALTGIMENISIGAYSSMMSDDENVQKPERGTLMKDKSKAVLWVCFTAIVLAGMKYVPPYLLEQRAMDMQERMLDLKEDAFLHQKVTPTVSLPEAVETHRGEIL
jgi:hypothetical protein